MKDRLIQVWRARPRLIVGMAMGSVALLGLGAFALNTGAMSGTGAPAAATSGPALDITVVAPVEPMLQPGERMEVGALVNGFDSEALKNATDDGQSGVDDYYAEQPTYTDPAYSDEKPAPRVRRYGSDGADPKTSPEDWGMVEGRGDRMGLGFDGPRPESGAEREARRTATRVTGGEPQRRVTTSRLNTSRPSGDPDAAFY